MRYEILKVIKSSAEGRFELGSITLKSTHLTIQWRAPAPWGLTLKCPSGPVCAIWRNIVVSATAHILSAEVLAAPCQYTLQRHKHSHQSEGILKNVGNQTVAGGGSYLSTGKCSPARGDNIIAWRVELYTWVQFSFLVLMCSWYWCMFTSYLRLFGRRAYE